MPLARRHHVPPPLWLHMGVRCECWRTLAQQNRRSGAARTACRPIATCRQIGGYSPRSGLAGQRTSRSSGLIHMLPPGAPPDAGQLPAFRPGTSWPTCAPAKVSSASVTDCSECPEPAADPGQSVLQPNELTECVRSDESTSVQSETDHGGPRFCSIEPPARASDGLARSVPCLLVPPVAVQFDGQMTVRRSLESSRRPAASP